MSFTNSKLATVVRISPFRNSPRNQPITKITLHHMAGVLSLEQFGDIVTSPGEDMSANYAVDKDARVGLFCPESDRSWCSSSPWNDNRAITIEISNSAYGDASGWPVSDKVMAKVIDLCVDICKRNGIKKMTYTGDRNGSLTFHQMFTATSCLPIDRTELLTPTGWKLLKDIKIGDTVATAHIDNLEIKFDEVENIVPVKTQDTYTIRDFEATSDHRVLYYNQAQRQYLGQYKDLYNLTGSYYLPNAGYCVDRPGLNLSFLDIEFLVAVQADGHYMRDGNCVYGIEFHLKKERKIQRLMKLMNKLGLEYKVCNQSDGTTKLRIYGKNNVALCEEFLDNKCFTWDWLNMTHQQALHFLSVILQYDGCVANNSYSSSIPENVNIVQAIAAMHGIGTKLADGGTRVYFKKQMRSLGVNTRKRNPKQQVSCVTVRSGFILIRQHGRTTITGNCPGPYIKARAQEICNKINARLGSSSSSSTGNTSTSSANFKKGDLVSINSNGVYYDGSSIPSWVKKEKWFISYISGDRAVLGMNESKNRNIQSPISTRYLTKSGGSGFKSYTKSLKSTETLYTSPGGNTKGTIGTSGIFTIVEEKTVKGVKYGKLKSGAGWVKLTKSSTDNVIRVGDTVKVLNNVQYNGESFKVYCSSYKVLEVRGDRVVISSDGKNVTCAINSKNLKKL